MTATLRRNPVVSFAAGDPADVTGLGGKGASLARMQSLGLPVPPGLIISTDVCHRFTAEGAVPGDVWESVLEHLADVEAALGRRLGDEASPLLLSVRSGAPVSMPGMMDTILDIGISEQTLPAIAAAAGESFAWETYGRLIRMFGTAVTDIDGAAFETARLNLAAAADNKELVGAYLKVFEEQTGQAFPRDPADQLRQAVSAVFRSWNSPRADRYRRYAGISDGLGTAVVIQAMVFGNLDDRSGTGVAFTRDPATGARGLYGDFLLRAQGEDVVAGEADPDDIELLRREIPDAYEGLVAAVPVLEQAYGDMCDIEFTVESGRFWLLQVRRGQRTAHAAVRIALDLTDEGLVDLDDAVRRIPPASLIRIRDPQLGSVESRTALGRGLPASPGAAVGKAVFSSARAEELAGQGHDVILVRPYTSPDDISGFIAARGVVTAHGGRTSHAAVVARGMDLPAVCGVPGLSVAADRASFPGGEIREGDAISLDGSTGEVLLGELSLEDPPDDPRVRALLERCDSQRRVKVLVRETTGHDGADPRGTDGAPAEHIEFGHPTWADGVLSEAGTAVVGDVEALEEALDDDTVERVVLDLGGGEDPVSLLKAAAEAVELGVAVLALVDSRWPTSIRSLPKLPWAGMVAGDQGDWTARLLAAVSEEA